MPPPKYNLRSKDREQVFALLRQHQAQTPAFGVAKTGLFGLFGSFVRGEQTDGSDVGILVQFERGKKTFKNFMRLAYFLEALFNLKTEVVTTESLSPFISQASHPKRSEVCLVP
ncbi:MAG: nucleotidyltransferase [Saprospiraceae bacterium]|nr:MAG: nucleotidyltransferase [Saprospiraceae bacterium]